MMPDTMQTRPGTGEPVFSPASDPRGMLRLVLDEGGPGFCQFAITSHCNAGCRFCGFSRDARDGVRRSVATDDALAAVDHLARWNIRYLVITGGEPLLHSGLTTIVRHAASRGMTVLIVTNGSLLAESRVKELAAAGTSGFLISIDAMDAEAHEAHRGLPGVCGKIKEANGVIKQRGLHSTASVTMSRLVDYDAVPGFLGSLGFPAVTFSYPLLHLKSSFLGFAQSGLVSFREEELIEAFEKVKRLKKRFLVVNPTPSLEEMQRFLRREPQRYPCLAGYKYFYLDWNLDLWRCHNWEKPLCRVFAFDGSQTVRDGCTECMIDCYRDSSVLHYIGVALHDAYQSGKALRMGAAARALMNRSAFGSLRAVFEEFGWIRRL